MISWGIRMGMGLVSRRWRCECACAALGDWGFAAGFARSFLCKVVGGERYQFVVLFFFSFAFDSGAWMVFWMRKKEQHSSSAGTA